MTGMRISNASVSRPVPAASEADDGFATVSPAPMRSENSQFERNDEFGSRCGRIRRRTARS